MSGWTPGNANYNSTTLINIGNRDIGNKSDTRLVNTNNFEFVLNTHGPADAPRWHQVVHADINRIPEFSGNNVNNTEIVINTNGKSDENKWIQVVHKDITVNAGGESWIIPIVSDTNGVAMPVELADDRNYGQLDSNHSFNTKNFYQVGLMSSIPNTTNIPVKEPMVVGGNWRLPYEDYVILVEQFTFNTKNRKSVGLMSSKSVSITVPVTEQMIKDGVWRNPEEAEGAEGAYRIAGTTTHGARVLIVDENTWELEHTRLVPEGDYEVPGLQSGLKLIVSRKDDGESTAYGAVEAVPEE